MIIIEVTACDGQPIADPALVAEFDETGGSIGRTLSNRLVLPDANRHISRTHASIVFRAGQYIIRDMGTASPVIVNGRALGNGHEAPIGDGDELRIAAYTLRVMEGRGRAHFGPDPDREPPSSQKQLRNDPLLALGSSDKGENPFADLISPSAVSSGHVIAPASSETRRAETDDVPARSSPPAQSAPAIPEDFDPFAPPPTPAGPAIVDDLNLGPSVGGKLDDLFDLDSSDVGEPFRPGSPLAAPGEDPINAPIADPLIAIGAAPDRKPPGHSPQRNDAPEIQGAFAMPKAKSLPLSAPLLVEEKLAEGGPAAMSPAKEDLMVGPATTVEVKRDDRAPESHRGGSAPAETASAAPDDLMREFMAGAGLLDENIPIKLTPETMNLIGQLLRECIQGTLDLLLARAVAKQQMRAGVTILVARNNNPLKFSPTVEMALGHLLGQQHRGFMSPRDAVKDAYEDLRKHQVGTMVGVQAALASVLARFRPDRVEKQLTESSVMDTLLPANRKAKLWDLFAELHKDISKEAEDDFEALFGKEFVRAYEAQIAELERPDAAPSS